MRTFEGIYYLSDSLDEESVAKAWESVRGEIEKLGGVIREERNLGRKTFARSLNKQKAGYHTEVVFDIDPAKIATLRERYKIDTNVFRVMIVAAGKQKVASE